MGTIAVARRETVSSLNRLLYSPSPNWEKGNKYDYLNNNPGKKV